eukprot:5229486-Pyramimonas_sp.AAC.2
MKDGQNSSRTFEAISAGESPCTTPDPAIYPAPSPPKVRRVPRANVTIPETESLCGPSHSEVISTQTGFAISESNAAVQGTASLLVESLAIFLRSICVS